MNTGFCAKFTLGFGLVACTFLSASWADAQIINREGKLLLPERRINGWVVDGADRQLMELTYSRIQSLDRDGPGGWSYEWMAVADYFAGQGDQYLAAGDARSAEEEYLLASLYYAIGYFPDNHITPQQRSYKKHIETYLKAGKLFDPPMQVLRIPFEDNEIIVYLHRPAGVERPPLVLWTGGSDWWKASYHKPIRLLVDRGVAVAAFDIAGTGESTAWLLAPDSEKLHVRVLEYFSGSEELGSKRGLVGVSFGGYFALKMAARNSGLDVVVNYCGLAHHAFVRSKETLLSILQTPEGATIRASLLRSGIDIDDYLVNFDQMSKERASFSLVNQGLLGEGKTIHTPLLNVNGSRDPIAPVSDTELVDAASTNSETWWLGTSGHCASQYRSVLYPQLVDWVVEKLQ